MNNSNICKNSEFVNNDNGNVRTFQNIKKHGETSGKSVGGHILNIMIKNILHRETFTLVLISIVEKGEFKKCHIFFLSKNIAGRYFHFDQPSLHCRRVYQVGFYINKDL